MLEDCMNAGMSESEFQSMSVDEIGRQAKAKSEYNKNHNKEVLGYIYLTGALVSLANGRNHFKNAKYPPIEELFPNIFSSDDKDESQEELVMNKSIQAFKMFATLHNKRMEVSSNGRNPISKDKG